MNTTTIATKSNAYTNTAWGVKHIPIHLCPSAATCVPRERCTPLPFTLERELRKPLIPSQPPLQALNTSQGMCRLARVCCVCLPALLTWLQTFIVIWIFSFRHVLSLLGCNSWTLNIIHRRNFSWIIFDNADYFCFFFLLSIAKEIFRSIYKHFHHNPSMIEKIIYYRVSIIPTMETIH